MHRFFVAMTLALFGLTSAAWAADYFSFKATTYADGTSMTADAGLGIQYSVRCADGGARYKFCDLTESTTCTATVNELVLMQDRTYDICVPAAGSSDRINGRVALLSEGDLDGGVAICRFYQVKPATLPGCTQ